MSDNATSNGDAAAPKFTERELQILGWAMQSLKSGPPEIDYEKLAGFAGMSNPRSASNAWASLKKKLMTDDPNKPAAASKPATPKKPKAKAKAKADADAQENDTINVGNASANEETPKKATPRKRKPPVKKEVEGEGSPKKRGRKSKKAEQEELAAVKDEEVPDSEATTMQLGEGQDEV